MISIKSELRMVCFIVPLISTIIDLFLDIVCIAIAQSIRATTSIALLLEFLHIQIYAKSLSDGTRPLSLGLSDI